MLVTSCPVQNVVCRQDLTSKMLVILLYVILCAIVSRASSRCKHDVGALSCLNVEAVKRGPPPSLADLYPLPKLLVTCFN